LSTQIADLEGSGSSRKGQLDTHNHFPVASARETRQIQNVAVVGRDRRIGGTINVGVVPNCKNDCGWVDSGAHREGEPRDSSRWEINDIQEVSKSLRGVVIDTIVLDEVSGNITGSDLCIVGVVVGLSESQLRASSHT